MKTKSGILIFAFFFVSVALHAQKHTDTASFSKFNLPPDIVYLDVNYINALIPSRGTFFWDGYSAPAYIITPRDATTIFSSSIWVGGKDPGGDLHVSGERFNQGGYDYFPGPLMISSGNAGTTDTSVMEDYNQVWKIDRADLLNYLVNGDTANNIEANVMTWPAHGPLGYSENLAPFEDENQNGVYEPGQGEFPEMHGDQMTWQVFNDYKDIENSETGGTPLGIEIQNMFYAYRYDNPPTIWDDLINYQTFQNIKIINRSDTAYNDVFIGIFVDGDLGNPIDDFIGFDVEYNGMLFYNGDCFDEDEGASSGFGDSIPVQTISVLNATVTDSGTVVSIEDTVSAFFYFNNYGGSAHPATTDPADAEEYYSYLNGTWKDSTKLFYGGTGHYSDDSTTNIEAKYAFPGESDPEFFGTDGVSVPPWSEVTENNEPGDRRGMMSIGPFTLEPGDVHEIELLYGYIPYEIMDTFDCGNELPDYTPVLDSLITWSDEDRIPSNYLAADTISGGMEKPTRCESVNIFPNPAADMVYIQSTFPVKYVSVINSVGVKLERYPVSGEKQFSFSTSELSSGEYFIEISNDGKPVMKKLMIY
ncbi:MAG: T9SS type A sorting domain-containing protein [Bacteroidales bacterium]